MEFMTSLFEWRTAERLMRLLSLEEPSPYRHRKSSRMNMELLSQHPFRPTEIQFIHLYKELTIMDPSCLDSDQRHFQSLLTNLLRLRSLKPLIIVLETSQTMKWSLLLSGMKRCLISTDFGQLMTLWCILNTQLCDLQLWLTSMKLSKCL